MKKLPPEILPLVINFIENGFKVHYSEKNRFFQAENTQRKFYFSSYFNFSYRYMVHEFKTIKGRDKRIGRSFYVDEVSFNELIKES